MGRCNGTVWVVQKHGHKWTITKRNQVRRHGLYSGHYSGVFIAPKIAQNAETKRQAGAVPILLLAFLALTTSAYTSLGVSQGLNPQRWLLKASVYHSATSAVWCQWMSGQRWKQCMVFVWLVCCEPPPCSRHLKLSQDPCLYQRAKLILRPKNCLSQAQITYTICGLPWGTNA